MGFSQEQLAFDAGFDRTSISLMERGLLSPTLRTMVRLCRLLKLSLAQLAKQIEESEYF
jgi:transcriptional regulator with XRE-family HTH domain